MFSLWDNVIDYRKTLFLSSGIMLVETFFRREKVIQDLLVKATSKNFIYEPEKYTFGKLPYCLDIYIYEQIPKRIN